MPHVPRLQGPWYSSTPPWYPEPIVPPKTVVSQCAGKIIERRHLDHIVSQYDWPINDVKHMCSGVALLLYEVPPNDTDRALLNRMDMFDEYLTYRDKWGYNYWCIDTRLMRWYDNCPDLVYLTSNGNSLCGHQMYNATLNFTCPQGRGKLCTTFWQQMFQIRYPGHTTAYYRSYICVNES